MGTPGRAAHSEPYLAVAEVAVEDCWGFAGCCYGTQQEPLQTFLHQVAGLRWR